MRATTLFFALGFCLIAAASINESDTCRNSLTNRTGLCKTPTRCPSAYLDATVQNCSAIQVCCTSKAAGFVSAAKCAEYSARFSGKCPVRSVDGNRSDASKSEFPHMVSLRTSSDAKKPGMSCTGTLISERFVLTGDACVNPMFGKMKYAYFLDGQVRNLRRTYAFPGSEDFVLYHGLGLVKLEKDVAFAALVRPACLYNGPELKVKAGVVTVGFGIGGELRRKTGYMDEIGACRQLYRHGIVLPEGVAGEVQMCVGSDMSVCMGASGLPLHVIDENIKCTYSVAGLLGFGSNDCGAKVVHPKVYTKLAPYLGWIESVVWPTEQQ